MTPDVMAGHLDVDIVTAELAHRLVDFARRFPLAYNDFASIAATHTGDPRVWAVSDGREMVAAAIDDGVAMTVAGAPEALRVLATAIPDIGGKLIISGRLHEVMTFVEAIAPARTLRLEHFMALDAAALAVTVEPRDVRIATNHDLPMLLAARRMAILEEYGIEIRDDTQLLADLTDALERAVRMQGVAVEVEDGQVAFTAQLISKTSTAAMFGDLFTDPRLRGHGRATKALALFCTWLMTESRHVTLRVGVDNMPAIRLYERVGFTTVDTFGSSLRVDASG